MEEDNGRNGPEISISRTIDERFDVDTLTFSNGVTLLSRGKCQS